MTTSTVSADATGHRVTGLIAFATAALPRMQLEDGCFCFERRIGHPAPIGRSPRYTLMVELGLLKAQAAGYAVPFELDQLESVAWREMDERSLSPGDIGLMLWIDARRNAGRGPELADRLDAALRATGGLARLVGMELGWIVTGLAQQIAHCGSPTAARLLEESLDQLLARKSSSCDLFEHVGFGRRGRFPNFATQIYSVLALAVVARHQLDQRALRAACATADRLLATQLPDGGWPWLFDAKRGTVVERYELYSVHQDAMAPMALLELWEVCGDDRYLDAVARGLSWIYGGNELALHMIDPENALTLRSIRRARGYDRFWLGAKTAAAVANAAVGSRSAGRMTEANPTDRPYHFGWVLEAWCGREDALVGRA